MKILSAKQIKETDHFTIKKGNMTSTDLMERASSLCFNWIHNRLQGNNIPIRVFCGTGHNGGDGLVIARHLKQHGYNVFTYVVNCGNKRTQDFLTNYDRLKEIGVWPEMVTCAADLPDISENDMVIDAIFGIGLSRPPEDVLKEVIMHINASNAYILSVDVPSGMYPDKSIEDREAVIRAYHVVTFQTPKLAFLLPENEEFLVSYDVIDIGLDLEYIYKLPANAFLIEKYDILPIYKPRKKFAHKGDFGHSLLIGGSFGKIGAITLASRAALNIGSGLVTSYIPKCGYEVLQTSLPEVMVEVNSINYIEKISSKTDSNVVGIGPGLGTAAKTLNAFREFLEINKNPLVLDADAINLLAKDKKLLKLVPKDSVLTPHFKEFERLVGKSKNDFERLDKLKQISNELDSVVLLKGAHTAIAYKDILYFNGTGNPGLATGGSGDVLTGFITGLIAQGYGCLEAAIFGTYLHGKSADIAMNDLVFETFTATDIIEYLPTAFKDLFKREMQNANASNNDAEEQE